VVHAGQGAALFMEDGSHPSPSGNQLIAQTFYNTIFAVPAGS
jgi:lysophospholipase L1-like esterase